MSLNGTPKTKIMIKVIAKFKIVYREEEFPHKFYDEFGNIIATDREISLWAKDRYAADMRDIINYNEFYSEDVNVTIERKEEKESVPA